MVLISEKWTRQLLFSELFSTRPFLRNLTLSLSFPLTRFSLDVSKAQLICWWNSLLVLLWICSHYCRANEQRAARERFYYHLKRKNTLVIEIKLHNLWWFVLPWNARYTLVCIHWTTNSMIWDFESIMWSGCWSFVQNTKSKLPSDKNPNHRYGLSLPG